MGRTFEVRCIGVDATEARTLMARLSATLAEITGDGGTDSFDPRDMAKGRSAFCVAFDAFGVGVGCGAYRPLIDDIAEVKRMYAVPGTKGVGRAVLSFLECRARGEGYTRFRLSTRTCNMRAVTFYLRNGFRVIDNYGLYAGRAQSVCFEKRLV